MAGDQGEQRFEATPRHGWAPPEADPEDDPIRAMTGLTVAIIKAARDGHGPDEILGHALPRLAGLAEPARSSMEDHVREVVRAIADGPRPGSEG